ncbi:ribonuclease H-like protein [Dichomitus squalens]|uniref:Ribonuclease H-like protein n=1 Tax=Dichomitus squalens TaxID=114155 RepID=A0A4Q9NC45_9APHY|nr:ribonuclease H-like protein [Dichomitus squalens]TBU51161.1 ribonuclease H-like protein [Dichomitus squalens]
MYAKSEIMKRREAVGIDDVRDLVLHLTADAPPPSWVRVENPRSINKVVALLIPGLTPDILSLPPLPTSATSNPNVPLQVPLPQTNLAGESSSGVPFINSTFTYACPTRAPGDQSRMHSVLNTFFQGPVTGEEKKRRLTERLISERTQEKSPMRYLLTLEQMIENGYPVPSYLAEVFEKPPGWVETKVSAADATLLSPPASDPPRIYAIDCEMCLTEDGKQLARVCLIDYASSIVVYDALVKPSKPVTDYLTRWSGITAEGLSSATASFDDVQSHILSVLSASPTPVLLGHSLESDLQALKICHPRCIDTALIYHHPRGRPLKPGLAWLTKKWCGREIQNRGEGGHDPEEDARACLDLLRKKVENGPGFGEFKVDTESIFERMSRSRTKGNAPITSAVVDHGNPAAWHGQKATTCIACKSDADVLAGLLSSLPSHHFLFGRLTALADVRGWITPKVTGDEPVPPPTSSTNAGRKEDGAALLETMATLDKQLRELYTALPARTAVVIFTGHADPRRMAELNARKAAFENALKAGKSVEELGKEARWTSADGRELEEEVEKAKRGLLFLGVKGA